MKKIKKNTKFKIIYETNAHDCPKLGEIVIFKKQFLPLKNIAGYFERELDGNNPKYGYLIPYTHIKEIEETK